MYQLHEIAICGIVFMPKVGLLLDGSMSRFGAAPYMGGRPDYLTEKVNPSLRRETSPVATSIKFDHLSEELRPATEWLPTLCSRQHWIDMINPREKKSHGITTNH